jgi:hypothetical protein
MFKKMSTVIVLASFSFLSMAQKNTIPCVIGSNGIILNQRSIISRSQTLFTVTALEDTVKLSDARSLFALEVLKTTDNNIEVEKVTSFSLTIVDQNGDSTKLEGTDTKFSNQISARLKELKTNSRLIFENIRYDIPENLSQSIRTGMLMFYVL